MKIFYLILIMCCFIVSHAFGDNPAQQFDGFRLEGKDGNRVSWDVSGDRADILGKEIKVTNVVANKYGDENMHLTADNGTLNQVTKDMLLEDNVVITTDSGATMVTDRLNWQREKDLVSTEDEVVIKRERMTAIGKGAEAQPNFSSAKLQKDVTVTVDVEDEQKQMREVVITCDGPLEIEYENEKAVFNDNVVAIDGERKLVADKVIVYFDMETNQINKMVCQGNVEIYQGDNASYSQEAVYLAKDKRIILSGRPKLIFYPKDGGDVSFGN